MSRKNAIMALFITVLILVMISLIIDTVQVVGYVRDLKTRSAATIGCAGYPTAIATECYATEIAPVR